MISILLPSYKSEMLLSSIFWPGFEANSVLDSELIIYDNGGNGNSKSLAKEQNVKWIGDGNNVGLNCALNECAKVASGDYFYLPHTDMYLMPGWDIFLLDALKNKPPGKQLLCSRSIEPIKGHTEFHIIKNYGMEWSEFREEDLLYDFENYNDNSIVSGYRMPFFMHRKLWEKMGGVDSNYHSYSTDDDLVQTAYDVGVRQFWMVNNSLVYHLQGKSNQQQSVDRDSIKPYLYFINKWKKRGYEDAIHPGQWHPKLIPLYVRIK